MAKKRTNVQSAPDTAPASAGRTVLDEGLDGVPEPSEHRGLSRRELLKLAAGAVAAAPLASIAIEAAARTPAAPAQTLANGSAVTSPAAGVAEAAPKFFSKEQFAMVDEMAEMIIPADDHSPGARAAKVAEYIDARLAEEFEDKVKQNWVDGLKAVDELSQQTVQKSFMEASASERHSVMVEMAKGEKNPKNVNQKFFGLLKEWTAFGYYTSKIGIHQEMEYKGNTYQQEFSGHDAV